MPGLVQTLASQNEDGEWEIIDPPDYDLQYALCSLYSPTTGEWIGYQHSNPNLLDNWYFSDPVNQRGLMEYAGRGYMIDRWYNHTTDSQFLVGDGYITYTGGPGTKLFYQPLEVSHIAGMTLTMSALTNDGVLTVTSGVMVGSGDVSHHAQILGTTWHIDIWEYNGNLRPRVYKVSSVSDSISLVALKLELGPVQTLAHQDADGNWVLNDPPPNRALELAKCQRYQVAPAPHGAVRFMRDYVQGSSIYFAVPISATLRAKPVISDVSKLLIFNNLDNKVQTGFTYSVVTYGPGFVAVSATKENHGLTDAGLTILGYDTGTTNFLFDANL